MCGIVGYIGTRDAVERLLKGLKSLEYRGYDSSGIAVHTGNHLAVVKRAGKLSHLEAAIAEHPLSGHCGIGHTRWATHGAATDLNAHPFISSYSKFAVVHNGIITNYLEVAAFLRERGIVLSSDTDSEVVAHLIDFYYTGDVSAALRRAVSALKGSFALGVLSVYEPEKLYGVRKDSPLILGKGEKEFSLCSDISGISDFCDRYCPLENGEIVCVTESGAEIFDFAGKKREVLYSEIERDPFAESEECGDYMRREIGQIPISLLSGYESFPHEKVRSLLIKGFSRILLIGCGSAYHAALTFQQAMREWCGVTVEAEIASEYLIERRDNEEGTLVIAVSQSGETADTLQAVRKAKSLGGKVLSVCNVRASSLVRLSEEAIITRCGVEHAVAATKSYVSQVHSLLMICLEYAEISGKMDDQTIYAIREELREISSKIEEVIHEENYLATVARMMKDAEAVYFLGRKQDYAAAKEGSLKLKEISYLFSEAYPAGELKHGTLALMEKGVFALFLLTDPLLAERHASSVAEVACRGTSAVVIASKSLAENAGGEYVIALPDCTPLLSPLLSAVAMQLIAYHIAKARGCDVDKPRNLAKSVTVE